MDSVFTWKRHTPAAGYDQFDDVIEIFEEIEVTVNKQLWHETERLSGQIDQLGLVLASDEPHEPLELEDTVSSSPLGRWHSIREPREARELRNRREVTGVVNGNF